MRLNAPSFWYPAQGKECRASEILLTPLAILYQLAHRINYALQKPYRTPMPVICIGNINIGGSGKTPVAISIMEILQNNTSINAPYFLSRGYGGLINKPTVIDPDIHDYIDVGDEAMLLHKTAPVITAKKRVLGAKHAEEKNAGCLLMDDGLQNNSLQKTITFCVIDGKNGFGNGKTFPAGPLRETPAAGFNKSDAFIIVGKDVHNIGASLLSSNKPVFHADLEVAALPEKDKSYVAFAGIAHPEKFKNTLEQHGLKISSWHPLPDHYDFSVKKLIQLAQAAKDNNSTLITTEKDFIRLPEEFLAEHKVITLPVKIKWHNQKAITDFLDTHLTNHNKAA